MTKTAAKNLTRFVVPCRFSYLNCWEPKAVNYGDEPKYSVSAIIPKSDAATIKKIKSVIEQVKKNEAATWGGKVPNNLKVPLRDGDEDRPDDEAYQDSYFFNANSRTRPEVVDAQRMPITDQSLVYSGCWGKISVTFKAYNYNGTKGIAAYLGNIQKLRDGAPLGNVFKAEDDFEVEEDTDFEDPEGFLN